MYCELMQSSSSCIVFVINSLTAGGAERALIDMLAYLEDYLRGYNVHLVLLDVEEELHDVPSWVQKHVLDANFSFFWSTILLRSEEHTSELQSLRHLVCRLLLEKKKKKQYRIT